MGELLHADITGSVLGAAMEVHRTLGPGYLESIYEEAVAIELNQRGLSFVRQARIPINYKNNKIGEHILDFIVEDRVVVELKAISELAEVHKAIVISYLAASRLPIGLLINFGQARLEWKRIVRQKQKT